MPAIKGRYWIATLHTHAAPDWQPAVNEDIVWMKGQREIGTETEREHWQFVFNTAKQMTLNQVKTHFPPAAHLELTRSNAAEDYCGKEETRVAGSNFEIGRRKMNLARNTDWDAVLQDAKRGKFDDIPANVYVRYRTNLRSIYAENCDPPERTGVEVRVYWGSTGTGKTHRAVEEAKATGKPLYWKSSRNKWWDGYKGQENVLIDEFSGNSIDIDHLKRWFDNYPCQVEVKGGVTNLHATKFWVTSNVNPDDWFPTVATAHCNALRRRLTEIVLMDEPYVHPQ